MSQFRKLVILVLFMMSFGISRGAWADVPASKIDYANDWETVDSQGSFGTCAVFTTIGLLEAEYMITFGEKINFSQGDLWLHLILGKTKESAANYFHQIIDQQIRSQWTVNQKDKIPGFLEKPGQFGEGFVKNDFVLAQEIGLKAAGVAPYEDAKKFFIGVQDILKGLHAPNPKKVSQEQSQNPVDKVPAMNDFFLKLLEKEDGELNRIFDSTKNFVFPDPTWLSRLQLSPTEDVGSMNSDQKKDLILKVLTCKPVGVDITSDYYYAIMALMPKSSLVMILNPINLKSETHGENPVSFQRLNMPLRKNIYLT